MVTNASATSPRTDVSQGAMISFEERNATSEVLTIAPSDAGRFTPSLPTESMQQSLCFMREMSFARTRQVLC